MKIKKWIANWEDNTILVENSWDWSGDTEEKIFINDQLIQSRNYNLLEEKNTIPLGKIFEFKYQNYNIKILLGSAWHMLGMACRIEVNGKYIGGNKIVMFAKK